jgi:hypothetical protein
MSSRNLLNLVLLVVVAALVAVAVFKPGKKTPPVTRLTSLSASAVHKITISRPGAEQVVLEKQDGKWRMLAPYKIAADGFKADSITELAKAKANAHYPITKDEDLKPYGLDKPRISVTFNDKDKLEFGGIETLKYQRYIRSGDTLFVIFDRYFSSISNPPAEFVDHTLLPGKPSIDKLVLPKLSLSRQGDHWQAQPPVKELSNDQVNELLENWRDAHASDVHKYTPEKNAQQVKVYIKGQDKPVVFDLLYENKQISLGRADLGLKFSFTPEIGKNLLSLPPKIKPATAPAQAKPTPAKH